MVQLRWPYSGLEVDRSFHGQSPDTTPDALNVRNYDCTTGRSRGAQRPGLSRWISAQVNGANPVQNLIHIATLQDVASSLTAQNIRTLKLLAVAGGSIYRDNAGAWTVLTAGTGVLDANQPTVFSAVLDGIAYYVDGTSYIKATAATNTAATWTASPGTLPTNSSNTARLICTWRRRIVLAGVATDGHNWFMSASGDPLDFDYTPEPQRETQAVAGNQHVSGECPDVITGLFPWSDDLLLMFGDHSIWQMTGDPMAGGRLDAVSEQIGGAWGRPFCKAPDNRLYFVSSRGGFYRLTMGEGLQRISERRIESKLDSVDLNTTVVRLFWDDKLQEVGIILTPLTATATTHYAWDSRNGPDGMGAFWPDRYASTDLDPVCVHVYDGDDPDDRVVLVGCKDGRVRKRDYAADDDDGHAIDSYVWFGPLKADNLECLRLNEVEVTLAQDSDPVQMDVFTGGTAEAAFNNPSVFQAILHEGRNRSLWVRRSGNAIYLRLRQQTLNRFWAFEACRAEVSQQRGMHRYFVA